MRPRSRGRGGWCHRAAGGRRTSRRRSNRGASSASPRSVERRSRPRSPAMKSVPVGAGGDAVQVLILLDRTPGCPGLAAIRRGEALAVGAHHDRTQRVEGADVEERSLQVFSLILFGPGAAAVVGAEDGGVVADGPAALALRRESHGGERGGGRSGHALPGCAAVAGTQDRAAFADGDNIAADDRRAEQQHAGRGIGLGDEGRERGGKPSPARRRLEQRFTGKNSNFRNPKSETSTKSEFQKADDSSGREDSCSSFLSKIRICFGFRY
jgi:hypothetical protein